MATAQTHSNRKSHPAPETSSRLKAGLGKMLQGLFKVAKEKIEHYSDLDPDAHEQKASKVPKTASAKSAKTEKSAKKAKAGRSHSSTKKSAHAHSEKNSVSQESASSHNPADVNPYANPDPAHSPGHRKLSFENEYRAHSGSKEQHQDLNRMAANDRVKRVTTPQRRTAGNMMTAGQGRKGRSR